MDIKKASLSLFLTVLLSVGLFLIYLTPFLYPGYYLFGFIVLFLFLFR